MTTGILQLPTQLTGTPGVYPNFKYMVTADNLATVSAAGYLNSVNLEGYPVTTNDVIQALYSYDPVAQTGTYEAFSVTISSTGTITLNPVSGASGVVLPTTPNAIAYFTNTIGTISSAPNNIFNAGNIGAGASASGTAGSFFAHPGTPNTGQLALAATANAGNFQVTFTNASFAQTSTLTAPDPGGVSADFVLAPAALVNNNLIKASGTAGLVADAGIAASAVMSTTAINTMSGSGQIILVKANGTEASNAVTASGNAGVITTSSLSTAGGASYAITWTNTLITATSVINLTIMGGTNTTENITLKATAGSGTSTLTIYNNTAATALNGTIFIGYTVF